MSLSLLSSRVADLAIKHGSLRAAALALGVTPAYLSRLRSGAKTNPSDKILRKLGVRRFIDVRFVLIDGRLQK